MCLILCGSDVEQATGQVFLTPVFKSLFSRHGLIFCCRQIQRWQMYHSLSVQVTVYSQ